MKYIQVFKTSLVLAFIGMMMQIVAVYLWRYQPWSFKWSFNIGSGLLLFGMMPFWISCLLALYKLNHEHFGVDRE